MLLWLDYRRKRILEAGCFVEGEFESASPRVVWGRYSVKYLRESEKSWWGKKAIAEQELSISEPFVFDDVQFYPFAKVKDRKKFT